MRLENAQISWGQYIFLFFGFINSISLIFLPAMNARHLVWLAVLGSMAEGTLYIYVYVFLSLRFPQKTFFEMHEIIFGSYLGKFVSFAYLLFFLMSTTLNLRAFANFYDVIFPETPILVFLIMTILLCATAVKKGIEVLVRSAQLLVPITFLFAVLDSTLLIKDLNLKNLLPLTDVPLTGLLQASQAVTSFLFGETIVFVMIIPYLKKVQSARKSFIPIALSGLFLAVISARNTAVLGSIEAIVQYPSYQAVRLINIAEVLTRLEVIVALNFFFMGFLRITLFYYGFVLGTAQLLKLRTYHHLIYPFAPIIIAIAIINFENVFEELNFAVYYFPIYSFPFQVGLPLLTLLIAWIRGLPKKEK